MTSKEIRQSFLDFFKSKQHTLVPSSSLMPDSPNLLFTNAGMNQFVPIFLGQVKCPYTPGRAADTQKCIRAGGKHNDLEDVGLDTYHHTFFEMLGNWSFGDYFKKEAIEWAWELVTGVWKFPKNRLYATVYQPDKSKGDPSEFDQEAYNHWARLFNAAGLDPVVHICTGGKKDNFWMMGDTGPCGPCSELHVDLTPNGDTKGALVNQGSAQCIEIWNLVFIQYNANADGSLSPLPAKHVDTGMGFERVTGIMQNTRGFTDFSRVISNYETDIFRPLFDKLEQLSGKKYGSTLPRNQHDRLLFGPSKQEEIDVAFRVIADHIRTLSFAIADGIQPGNTDRNYVLRRILRRAVRYGRTLGFHEPFFYKLVDDLADTMGDVFPEIRAKQKHVQEVIRVEEGAFNKTLDRGIGLLDQFIFQSKELAREIATDSTEDILKHTTRERRLRLFAETHKWVVPKLLDIAKRKFGLSGEDLKRLQDSPNAVIEWAASVPRESIYADSVHPLCSALMEVPDSTAFDLYDTYGFPLDLTELMARENGLTVDSAGFEKLMAEQRARARKAQKKEIIELAGVIRASSTVEGTLTVFELPATAFVGYDKLETPAKVLEVVGLKDKTAVILDTSACYAEMGGQVGDTGALFVAADVSPRLTSAPAEISAALTRAQPRWVITNTQKSGNTWLHFIEEGGAHAPSRAADRALAVGAAATPTEAGATPALPTPGSEVLLSVDRDRRAAIQRHHTVTHLLHWALHEVVSRDASQKGSFVGPDKLTFDFNHAPLTPQQIADIERLVNERILENAGVSWTEVKYSHIKDRQDVMQFFGDKYGEWVRVVQIGGQPTGLDGYSMELCGGTHCRATGEIGLFRIVAENAIAAGVRRIEAVAGLEAYRKATEELHLVKTVAEKVNSPIVELEKKIENLLAHQKELERQLKLAKLRNASNAASELVSRAVTVNGIPLVTHNLGDTDPEFLQAVADALKGRFKGVIVLGGGSTNAVTLVASVAPEFTAKVQAGKIIQQIAPIVGGKGGGRPDNARGGGKDVTKLDEALAKVKSLLG